MKTKLFYLLMCLFALTATNAQITSVAIVGEGAGGWPTGVEGEVDAKQLTKVGPTSWQITNITLTDGAVKFRSNNSWASNVAVDGTGAPLAGNWGKPLTGSSFPIGIGAENAGGSKDIIVFAGTYDITFDVATGNYAFNGPPVPVVKLIGTATGGETGIFMDPTGPNTYGLPANTTLVAGTAQFTVDGVLAGAVGFPSGIVTGIDTDFITVPAGKYTSLSYNYAAGEYTFVAAPVFNSFAIVGDAAGGWGGSPDPNQMTTVDGKIYLIKNLALTVGSAKIRQNNNWTDASYGSAAFPIGVSDNSNIAVTVAGTYDCIFNQPTGEYRFSLSSQPPVTIVGAGAGGWPVNDDPQMDKNVMSTTDGENYTLNNLVTIDGPVKFRQDYVWTNNWGGTAFPTGTPSGDNLNATAGTWNVTFTRSTGVYSFTAALAVNKFDAKSFSAYPNPTRDSWNIVSGNDDITSIQVYDVLGKAVYTKFSAAKEVSVNATELSKGVYFAKVSTANGQSTLKLIKE